MNMTSTTWRIVFEDFAPDVEVVHRVELKRLFGDDDQTPIVRWIGDSQLALLQVQCNHPQACLKIVDVETFYKESREK